MVSHGERGHHLDAGQMGVSLVRGLGPGVPYIAALHRGSGFRQGAAGTDASRPYLHPNGQIPAYEWNFSDVNPPVHAWATLFFTARTQALRGEGDIDFLKRSFDKLC